MTRVNRDDQRAALGLAQTRRHFFSDCGIGVGKVALASLLGENMSVSEAAPLVTSPIAPKTPHFAAKADAAQTRLMQ